jgi:hypothetical protein
VESRIARILKALEQDLDKESELESLAALAASMGVWRSSTSDHAHIVFGAHRVFGGVECCSHGGKTCGGSCGETTRTFMTSRCILRREYYVQNTTMSTGTRDFTCSTIPPVVSFVWEGDRCRATK